VQVQGLLEQDKNALSGEQWRRMWREDHGWLLPVDANLAGKENYRLPE